MIPTQKTEVVMNGKFLADLVVRVYIQSRVGEAMIPPPPRIECPVDQNRSWREGGMERERRPVPRSLYIVVDDGTMEMRILRQDTVVEKGATEAGRSESPVATEI